MLSLCDYSVSESYFYVFCFWLQFSILSPLDDSRVWMSNEAADVMKKVRWLAQIFKNGGGPSPSMFLAPPPFLTVLIQTLSCIVIINIP